MSGKPIVDNTWFIVALLFIYFVFWISFGLIKNRKISWIVFTIFIIIYLFNIYMPYWHPGILAFYFGMVYVTKKEKIDKILHAHSACIIILLCVSSVLLIGVNTLFSSGGLVDSILRILSAGCFAVFMIVLQTKVCFNSPILKKLSKISFEMYLYHGLFIFIAEQTSLLYSGGFNNDLSKSLQFMIFVLFSTIVFSYVMKIINKKLLSFLLKRK